MCGIAGWVDYKRNMMQQEQVMQNMCATLAPRGPDESGEWHSESCYFVHRRLVVIDRINGKQPMTKGSFTICYNGELYNTAELRNELKKRGYRFSGHSDTETLLYSFVEWEEHCLERLNGIFAFAVWNENEKRLFLARDRAGVKPLFYSVYNGGIIFASEIKALLKNPMVTPIVDREGIASLVLLGPARKVSDGVFNNIKALPPASCATFSTDGYREKVYWRLTAEPHNEDLDETAQHIKALLTDSIERQLISDVPLCTFLSGGLDSSIISAVAANKMNCEGKKLTTYSVDYVGNRRNFKASAFQPDEDAPWIVEMSEFIGSNHVNVEIDTPQLAEALIDSVYARDLPGMADVDSSLYLFCKEVKKRFPVALSGECADEIFAGYPWYRDTEALNSGSFPWAKSTNERFGLLRENILGSSFSAEQYVHDAAAETTAKTDYLDTDSAMDKKIREMFMLNFYWFMQTLLDRKDRCSMAHGLEVRVPFCDHRILQYAYNIPSEMKFFMNREKGLVRRAAESLLPYDVVWRKKSPYPKTHNPDYMREVLRRFGAIMQNKNKRITEILDEKALAELLLSEGKSFNKNWYGQLMTAPQMFAYLIQLETWLQAYNVIISA